MGPEKFGTDDYRYIGTELELFAHATNWKSYFSRALKPYVRGRVLEVGAGAGANTRFLLNADVAEWTALEPDQELYCSLNAHLQSLGDWRLSALKGAVAELDSRELFDTILYIDVLEHIEDDLAELESTARRLKPGGSLVVLSPAHQFFFSEFDRSIGHYRRYNRSSLLRLTPPALKLTKIWYLDSIGCIASCANKIILRQSTPTLKQILFWDRVLVAISRFADPMVGNTIGKSIVAVWTALPH